MSLLRRLHTRLTQPLAVAPDGGWGWVVVSGSFVAHVCVLGLAYSFGVLFRALLADEGLGGDRAQLALVGSLATASMLAMGVATGKLVHT